MKVLSIKILNNIWKVKHLGNQAILLETSSSISLSTIHQITNIIRFARWKGVIDVVPAYNSIAVFYSEETTNPIRIIQKLEVEDFSNKKLNKQFNSHQIPVCFENGLDWNEVEDSTLITKEEFITKFTKKVYTVAMLGFIPGFMYLDGLDETLHCQRKQNPRLKIPAGSVGIGGKQTGIYALESPGGWQIIGQTPIRLLNKKILPPTFIQPLDKVQFYAIGEDEFQQMIHEVD